MKSKQHRHHLPKKVSTDDSTLARKFSTFVSALGETNCEAGEVTYLRYLLKVPTT